MGLEKGMAIHSSILAWRIPRTEEPGRLQFMGKQRVGHDWASNTHTHEMGGAWDVSRTGWASNHGVGCRHSLFFADVAILCLSKFTSFLQRAFCCWGASSWGVGEGLAACLLPTLLLPHLTHPIPPRLCHFQGTTPLTLCSHPQLPALRLWFPKFEPIFLWVLRE